MKIGAQYFKDRCDIYTYETALRTNTEAAKTLAFSAVPCYAERVSNLKTALMLGIRLVDTFKILVPLTYDDEDITVEDNAKIVLTKSCGSVFNLRVEGIDRCGSCWEIEAVEE